VNNCKPVYSSEKIVDGESCKVAVYCRLDGSHYAKTYISIERVLPDYWNNQTP
jgi:hypothetical protein